MTRIYAGLFLLALATLTVEVLLTRVFDVLLWPNISFMIISGAIFGLGLGGLFELMTQRAGTGDNASAAQPALLCSVTIWALPLCLNQIPFAVDRFADAPARQMAWFLLLYLVVLAPFFFSGLAVCRLFARFPLVAHRLYFWDLSGAAIGTGTLLWLLLPLGPERLLIGAALTALCASWLFADGGQRWMGRLALGILLVSLPGRLGAAYAPLVLHDNKRDLAASVHAGRTEVSRWDPVSQITVVDQAPTTHAAADHGRKHIAYDGGSQSSDFFPFDGDFATLRRQLATELRYQFWQRGVLAAHYLRRDTGARVLIIGSAGGQETKAALMYGAAWVDAVEMVGTVVSLGTGHYAPYLGYLFEQPPVHVHIAEGRSFVRAARQPYDVIQIFSNYTTSSVASGSGAISPNYLLTEEAAVEYFTHLTPNGLLQINHFAYPRTIATLAAAWRSLGRTSFRSHVVVVEKRPPAVDYLPTLLVQATPWTASQLADLRDFFTFPVTEEEPYHIAEDPLHAATSFLPDAFYSGALPATLIAAAPYEISAVTDDRPYFHFLRKSLRRLRPDQATGLDASTADVINTELHGGLIPMDWIHLIVTGVASVFYGILFLLLPMWGSSIGRARWPGKAPVLLYFSLLGFGFIAIELLLIQMLMKTIGYPLYTVATVIAVMLAGAAVGSLASPRVVGAHDARWWVPFAGVILFGVAIAAGYPSLAHRAMAAPIGDRIAAAAAVVAPLAFFQGMPFPLGMAALTAKPRGAVAWAWSMNGLCTTVGGVATALFSLWLGFRTTLLIALVAYAAAGGVFVLLRRNANSERIARACNAARGS